MERSVNSSSEPTWKDVIAMLQQLLDRQFQEVKETLVQNRENTAKLFRETKEDLPKGIDQAIAKLNQPNGFVEPVLLEGIDKENKETRDKENENKKEVKPWENEIAQTAVELKKEKERVTSIEETRLETQVENDSLKMQQKFEVNTKACFRRLGEKNTPIELEIDGSNAAREQTENTLGVKDKETDLIVRERAEAKLEVEAENFRN